MADDSFLLSAIYDEIERDPLNVDLHERLLEIWEAKGDLEMAVPVAAHILTMDPYNKAAMAFSVKPSVPIRKSNKSKPGPSKTQDSFNKTTTPKWMKRRESHFYPELNTVYMNQQDAEKALEKGLKDLLLESKLLRSEISALGGSHPENSNITNSTNKQRSPQDGHEKIMDNLQAISQGRIHLAVPLMTPASVREVSRDILATSSSEEATFTIISDFESVIQWFEAGKNFQPSSSAASSSKQNNDTSALRSRLVARKTLLLATLPDKKAAEVNSAFTHIERTYLNRKYANDETMLGDPISDIPQGHFFVSEDNYAWDITELVQAISVNSGVMRNPLTRNMFTASDIRYILSHPLGSALKPLRSRQEAFESKLKNTHPDTISKIADLSKIMLEDQSVDGAPSRKAMDEFVGYVATLPDKEQEALKELKIPAKDRHTGQAYDYTVGEALRDANANVTCSHKVGDFLDQAAKYLGQ